MHERNSLTPMETDIHHTPKPLDQPAWLGYLQNLPSAHVSFSETPAPAHQSPLRHPTTRLHILLRCRSHPSCGLVTCVPTRWTGRCTRHRPKAVFGLLCDGIRVARNASWVSLRKVASCNLSGWENDFHPSSMKERCKWL